MITVIMSKENTKQNDTPARARPHLVRGGHCCGWFELILLILRRINREESHDHEMQSFGNEGLLERKILGQGWE